MKRGPRTPKKPTPANQRRAPPSLRPPLAAPAAPARWTPGLTRGRAPLGGGPPPSALSAAPAANAPPLHPRDPRLEPSLTPPLSDTLGALQSLGPLPGTSHQQGPCLPRNSGRAPLGVLSAGPQPLHALGRSPASFATDRGRLESHYLPRPFLPQLGGRLSGGLGRARRAAAGQRDLRASKLQGLLEYLGCGHAAAQSYA